MRSRVLTSFISGCVGVLALTSVTLIVSGCAPSSPPPPTTTTQAPDTTPSNRVASTSTPSTTSSTDVLNIGATRPKETPDPFAKPGNRGGGTAAVAVQPTETPTAAPSKEAAPAATPTPAPTPPPAPPKPPEYTLAGIFHSTRGPEALLSGKDGTLMVYAGQKLKDDYHVKSIDIVSRKVVLDKDNTDFVLPLETSAPGGPGPGK
jgi:hypothetical protein